MLRFFFELLKKILKFALINEDDYTKTRNYWKYLKSKLKKDSPQLVSATNQLKLKAPDGKMRLTDMLEAEGVVELAKVMPNNKAIGFLDWFTYSENTIDGRSTRIWLDLMLKCSLRQCVDWSRIDKNDYLEAMRKSVADSTPIKLLIESALTDRVTDREMFMKGIDYSYYYEQED